MILENCLTGWSKVLETNKMRPRAFPYGPNGLSVKTARCHAPVVTVVAWLTVSVAFVSSSYVTSWSFCPVIQSFCPNT